MIKLVKAWTDGWIYELNISHPPAHPISLANQAFGLGEGGQSLDLSFDFDYASYGYIYVPSGVWDKLKPSEYSAATFVALQAGPSVNLVPGAADGEFRIGEKSLLTKEFYSAGNYGSVRVESSLKAGLHAKLDTNNMSADRRYRGELYPIIGILVTYNTGQGSGIHVDASYGLAKDFEAFDVLTGINLSPRLTAALDVAWGLFTPSSTPYIGRQTVFDFALASRNSFDLNLQLSKIDNPSLTFGASGRLT